MVIGGRAQDAFGSNARLGQGEFLVAEADESDGSFLSLTPTMAVITNIDPEHLDYWPDLERIHEAFVPFVEQGALLRAAILCLDHPAVASILPQVRKRVITYGLGGEADVQRQRAGPRGRALVHACTRAGGSSRLQVPSRRPQRRERARGGGRRDRARRARRDRRARSRPSRHRRFEARARSAASWWSTTTATTRRRSGRPWPPPGRASRRRLVVVFQPHRYTRTRDLYEEFLAAFDDADLLVLTEIYAAGEAPIHGVSGERLYEALAARGHADVRFVARRGICPRRWLPQVRGPATWW